MEPRNEQEIADLLESGAISQQQAQEYRSQIQASSSQSLFELPNNFMGTPGMTEDRRVPWIYATSNPMGRVEEIRTNGGEGLQDWREYGDNMAPNGISNPYIYDDKRDPIHNLGYSSNKKFIEDFTFGAGSTPTPPLTSANNGYPVLGNSQNLPTGINSDPTWDNTYLASPITRGTAGESVFDSKPGTKKTPYDFATSEEYQKYMFDNFAKQPEDSKAEYDAYLLANQEEPITNRQINPLLPLGGINTSDSAYLLGMNIGADKGSRGRGMNIAAAGVATGLGLTRDILAGVGNMKTTEAVEDYYRKKQFGPDKNKYTANPQYRNNNYLGGSDYKYGGVHKEDSMFKFVDGGEMSEEQMMAEEMSQEQMAQERGGQQMMQDPQMQQMAQGIAQALQQGQQPEQIVQSLIKNGLDENHAVQMVQMVMQQMRAQQGQTQNPQEEQMEGQSSNPQEEMQEMPMMKNGGYFKHRVGDSIAFTQNGRRVTGKIKRIDLTTGKFYL